MKKLNYIAITSLLSGCVSNTTSLTNDVCRVDESSAFGKELLSKAQRVSGTNPPQVYGRCDELEELKSGARKRLSTWKYVLPVEDAKKLDLEDLPLKI
jgi:hypothetical protein